VNREFNLLLGSEIVGGTHLYVSLSLGAPCQTVTINGEPLLRMAMLRPVRISVWGDAEARERARVAWVRVQEQLKYSQGTLPAVDLRKMELNIQNRIYDS
jgi:hypothetical protein